MTKEQPDAPILRLDGIKKIFPNGTIALRGVDLAVRAGRVRGLLGANGAGKSTLIKILSATIAASGGAITWKGQETSFATPLEASKAGIATIHQNIPLVPTLSVLENVLLWKRTGWRHNEADRQMFEELVAGVGYDIDPDELVSELSIGARQMVCILQALSHNADLIVMDEPTASLAKGEREIVYSTVRKLAAAGKGIIFVSHFLDEIMALTDEVTVLRDGSTVLDANTNELTESAIADAIAGRTVGTLKHLRESRAEIGNVVLETRGLTSAGRLSPTSLTLRSGEVLGVAGLLGSGRSELVHAIFGSDNAAVGDVLFLGEPRARSPKASVEAGMALVPEDREVQSTVPVFEIWRNNSLPYLNKTAWKGIFLNPEKEREWAAEAINMLRIKAEGPDAFVTELSGGNAQKVAVSRWLFGKPRLLMLDEPTAGIDVGAKADILTLVRKLAAEGVAIILISSEFEEILAVADRVLVMRDGAVVAERNAHETSDHELILLASGKQDTENAGRKAPATGRTAHA